MERPWGGVQVSAAVGLVRKRPGLPVLGKERRFRLT
jgi:hypothetical protein